MLDLTRFTPYAQCVGQLTMAQASALAKDLTHSRFLDNFDADWIYLSLETTAVPVEGEDDEPFPIEIYVQLECEWFYNALHPQEAQEAWDMGMDPMALEPVRVCSGVFDPEVFEEIDDQETRRAALLKARPLLEEVAAILTHHLAPKPERPTQLSLF